MTRRGGEVKEGGWWGKEPDSCWPGEAAGMSGEREQKGHAFILPAVQAIRSASRVSCNEFPDILSGGKLGTL